MKVIPPKIIADQRHLFHGELTDAPGRNESWDHYLRYRGNGRWDLITKSTDFSGMEEIPESKEVMSTRQLVQWAIERDDENEESSQRSRGASDDDDVDGPNKSLGPYGERLREIAIDVGATYCVKCLDGWVNRPGF